MVQMKKAAVRSTTPHSGSLGSLESQLFTIILCLPAGVLLYFTMIVISMGGSEEACNIVRTDSAMTAPRILASKKPYLLYGTEWKKSQTTRFVTDAIESGYRFIDTACQPNHYDEAGVGDGWRIAAKKLCLSRSDLYLQTKFTSFDKQDPKSVPYDRKASLEDQVRQSLSKSLENLHTTYLDALILHSPMNTMENTTRVWRAFESFVDEDKVRELGIGNIYELDKLQNLYHNARIKPTIVQNRFYAQSNFDTSIRAFCAKHSITYQSAWTLADNREALASWEIRDLAMKKNLSPQTLMYAFMMAMGHTPLDNRKLFKRQMMDDVSVMERIIGDETILDEYEIQFMAKIIGLPHATSSQTC